ncbi:phage head closure protein [Alloscardovia omnicolens]|uniref:phage head closure protein n=1 Tax=Alloscardovia omnicolens TaxID=419015 RepID=UPI003A6FCE5A
MDIARMNCHITFQKREIVTDAIGNQKEVWTNAYSCYGTVSGEASKDVNALAGEVDKSDMAVTVRWCKATQVMNTHDYRLCFNGEVFDISRIDHLAYKKRAIKFYCTKEESHVPQSEN